VVVVRRLLVLSCAVGSLALVGAGPALACAGLVAPNGSVKLVRTATLAAYHDGIEHYITSFEFRGGGAKFGSIVPLPDMPKTPVTRGGKWTLQRLQKEVEPPQPVAASGSGGSADRGEAKEVYETEIDGLRITILKGGGAAVGRWAKREGFALTPDAPEVLDFYGDRSPYFMAARFVPEKAKEKDLGKGDGVAIHLRIPTDNPWVPLRILGLGKEPKQDVDADVFLLTDIEPAILPTPRTADKRRGMILERSEQASKDLMRDLSSDRGMGWMPESMWLSYLRLNIDAGRLVWDLAVDASGAGQPSEEDAYGKTSDGDGSGSSPGQAKSALAWLIVPLAGLGVARLRSRKVKPTK
jgi:hypothetical protein